MRNDFIVPSQAARMLGVSTETLRRWAAEGRIAEVRTPGANRGHRRYYLSEIEKLVAPRAAVSSNEIVVGYARVSSHDQKASGDLDRQVARLQAAGASTVYRDVASGLSETRSGLLQLRRRIEAGGVDRVLIVTRDRLARFGVSFLEAHLESHGASLTVLEAEDRDVSPEDELVSDLLALVASFSGRLYGLRSARRRAIDKALTLIRAEITTEDPANEQE
jgi:putative resolvase